MNVNPQRQSVRILPTAGSLVTTALRRSSFRYWAWIVTLVALICGLRCIHLGADTPSWLSPYSAGAYVDEGYKTLSARNLALFGETHWSSSDNYPGWMTLSPLPSWSYYAAFRLFGASLNVARCVSLAFFTLFLFSYAVLLRKRYSLSALIAGLVWLGFTPGLFFYSRIALLEVPLILFLYGFLFLLARHAEKDRWSPLLAICAIAPLLAFCIKLSALVYLAPVMAGLLLRGMLLNKQRRPAVSWGVIFIVGAGVATLVIMTSHVWMDRLELNPLKSTEAFLSNPLVRLSPFLVQAGWICGIDLLANRLSLVLTSPFRTAVLSLALLGPVGLAFFPYNPPRYYVPMLPAYALVICEWLTVRRDDCSPVLKKWLVAAVSTIGLGIGIFWAARVLDYLVLMNLPINMGRHPGLSDRMMVLLAFPVAIIVAQLMFWTKHEWLFSRQFMTGTVGACAFLFALNVLVRLGQFELSPTYQGKLMRAQIARAIPSGSSIIGDWAPFFALGTDLRPLYMTGNFNPPRSLRNLNPRYFLFCDTPTSQTSLEGISNQTDIALGRKLIQGEYNNKTVVLYPLIYRSALAKKQDIRFK